METPIHIAECQEPWIYWWHSLTSDQREGVNNRHFFGLDCTISEDLVRRVWETEKVAPLQDYDWIEMADAIFRDRNRFTADEQKEIWRQVYRIASGKI